MRSCAICWTATRSWSRCCRTRSTPNCTFLGRWPGPSTTRPDTDPHKLHAKLQEMDLTSAVLTDPEGRLVGVVRRDDLPSTST
jgi:hypothetical protein